MLTLLRPQHVGASDYRFSQYCLSEFRDQFQLDSYYPEYARECADGSEFGGNIDDPELYDLAGEIYLDGKSPTSINWELQPLTKYLFGISKSLLGTSLAAQYLLAAALLYTTYLAGRDLLGNKYLSLIPPAILYMDKLFQSQLNQTYLDLSLSLFALIFLHLLSRSLSSNRFTSTMIVLGLASLSKSFTIGLVLFSVGIVAILIVKKSLLSIYIKNSLYTVITYLLGYFAFFLYHPHPIDFINLHINILKFYRSYVPEYPKGEIFRIIFTGKWRKWYDDFGLIKVPEWSVLWPTSLALYLHTLIGKASTNRLFTIHAIWIGLYLASTSLRLVFPRYLLPVLPSLYIVSVYSVNILLTRRSN